MEECEQFSSKENGGSTQVIFNITSNSESDQIQIVKPDFSDEKLKQIDEELSQLKTLLEQKNNIIQLLDREKTILEKEKLSLKAQTDTAIKEKELIVMRYATKEKDVLDAKKEVDCLAKQLNDAKKEVKNVTAKYHMVSEEKGRLTLMLDEKCSELKRQIKENDKLKVDVSNLEMRLKWSSLKINQEVEERQALEKKLEEMTDKNGLKSADQQSIEKEANLILLKHNNEEKDKTIDILKKQQDEIKENLKKLETSLCDEIKKKNNLQVELEQLNKEHNSVEKSLSEEILVSAKLRSELEACKILKAQHAITEERVNMLEKSLQEKEQQISEYDSEITNLRSRENDLLTINKEMSEIIVELQSQIHLLNSKITAVETEKSLLQKESLEFDTKLNSLELRLSEEIQKRNEERHALTKHLSEKTKLCEAIKLKLDNTLGEFEVAKKKHNQITKELHRELKKYKKQYSDQSILVDGENGSNFLLQDVELSELKNHAEKCTNAIDVKTAQEPSKEHLVERILRLQQAAVRQTEKIDFLENHTMSLVTELQKKSKILQYYMLRDQAGALTTSKSDQHKTELAKYGGVMSAIYTGIKGGNQSMTLDLSLEINKKLQAVLEDTLLKNITLKENLDVLGLEVDKLTRQLAKVENKQQSREIDQKAIKD